jgi:hypothetical protein
MIGMKKMVGILLALTILSAVTFIGVNPSNDGEVANAVVPGGGGGGGN